MAFGSARQDEIGKIGSGEIIGTPGLVTSYTTFEEGLKGGLFAKYVSGGVELMDGSATPTIAGVVKRELTGAIEDGGLYSADNNVYADVIEGTTLVTVDVRTGLTISKFDPVYAYNAAGVDAGKATNASTDAIAVEGYFYEEIDTDVWSVRLK
jgi:hypothetical protein